MQSVQFVQVVNESPGYVAEILAEPGAMVKAGTPLIRLENWELANRQEMVKAQWRQVVNQERKARSEDRSEIDPVLKRKESVMARWDKLKRQQITLVVSAVQDGIWIAPFVDEMQGTWLTRGTSLGLLVDTTRFKFSAVIPQDEASNLFEEEILAIEVRLYGQERLNLIVTDQQIVPFQHDRLPSAALGWRGGGEVAVALSDNSGVQVTEPFFLIEAQLPTVENVMLAHGASGLVRFTLPSKSLFTQLQRSFRQLLQKRYRI